MATGLTATQVIAFRSEIELLQQQIVEEAVDLLYEAFPNDQSRPEKRVLLAALRENNFEIMPHDAAIRRQLVELRACERALERIENGDFGVCLECGEELEVNRLRGNPLTELCLSCSAFGRLERQA
ncbi:TraR/DksA family transcriptional regulator [Marinobacterium jannaschii]|uniref:TraR/DksA family transcriptional regulator n=1 Tax=Marinobacterium jannaschii TaxID=64970 RepID=UPI000A04B43C|nr:TraR/DksA C4-type zinc finger protein [Marinobacterium jannaschii]